MSKVYDTNTTATLTAGNYTLGTVLGSDVVSVSGTGAYDTKNVGTGKSVTATGLVLSGADAGNYVLTSTTASNTIGTITAASLTAGLTGTVSKVYDTNTTAPLAAGNYTLDTILGSDVVSVSGTGAYDAKNVGTGKTVTATGLVLFGADTGNYVLTSTTASNTIGTITPATLTYTANAASRAAGTANPVFVGTVTGLVGTDTLASATTGTATFTSPATAASPAGSYAINGAGLMANDGNYLFAGGRAIRTGAHRHGGRVGTDDPVGPDAKRRGAGRQRDDRHRRHPARAHAQSGGGAAPDAAAPAARDRREPGPHARLQQRHPVLRPGMHDGQRRSVT